MANAPTPGQRWMANALPLWHRKLVNLPPYPGGDPRGFTWYFHYKAYKNELNALIRKSDIDYYQNMFSDRKNNIKDMWKHLCFLLNPNKNNSQNKKSVSKLNINEKTITEDKNIANTFD